LKDGTLCHWEALDASTEQLAQQKPLTAAADARIARGITARIGSRHGEFVTLVCAPEWQADESSDQFDHLEPMLNLVGNYFHAKALGILVRERLAAQSRLKEYSLSRREREILYWASLGKTGWETGTILGISQKSAELHAENAKLKLNATNKTHAVAKAITHGVIPDLQKSCNFESLAWKLGVLSSQEQTGDHFRK
jgi:DNA-binding CsgD family transcriptional regulator